MPQIKQIKCNFKNY